MADLPRLHAQATRLILSLREGLERLEAAEVWLQPWCNLGTVTPSLACLIKVFVCALPNCSAWITSWGPWYYCQGAAAEAVRAAGNSSSTGHMLLKHATAFHADGGCIFPVPLLQWLL